MHLATKQFGTSPIAAVVCTVLALWVGPVQAELRITYPASNAIVPEVTIVLRGVGADPSATLGVEVLTNKWYPQGGTPQINSDGSWTYGPCHLGGQGQHNNHTIRVINIKGGKPISSASVNGVKRRN